MSATVQHSSESNEHYTPPHIVEAARATMGGIAIDPFSCALANEEVRADTYLTAGGFTDDWGGPSALVNPPGGLVDRDTFQSVKPGSRNSMSSAAAGWQATWKRWHAGRLGQAVFVCFNLEVLRLTQHLPGVTPACAYPICFLNERLRFWNETHGVEERGIKGTPSHPNAIVYLPPHEAETGASARAIWADACDRFRANYAQYGYVRI